MVLKDSDAATISDLVYKNPVDRINKGYNNNYEFLESSAHKDSAEGFFGAAFEKDNTIVIAFRGTNNPFNDLTGESVLKKIKQFSRDLEDDLFFAFNKWGISSRAIPQYKEALDFSRIVQEKYGVNKEIIITGHSLGGGLAQLVGIELKHKVISFDSPGALSVARNLFSQDRIDAHKGSITCYSTGPNLFNTIGKQIVDPIQISVKTSAYSFGGPNAFGFIGQKISQTIEFRYFEYSKEQHDSEYIYKAFNPISGEPISIVSYDEWPTWYEAYEQFNLHCILDDNPKEGDDDRYIDVFKVLDIFSDPEISDPKLSNIERFQKLATSQREKGNAALMESFTNMADQTQAVLDALDNRKPSNNNGFKFDSSIFDHVQQNFNLDDYLSEEADSGKDNSRLLSFQNLAMDQEKEGNQEFTGIFTQLADQTVAVIKELGVGVNLKDDEESYSL